MIKFDLKNLHKIPSAQKPLIKKFLKKIAEKKQGFSEILNDKKTLYQINSFAKKIEGKFSYIVVLGIGGSALGTICLQQSLKHLFGNELKNLKTPKLYVIDNIDPILIKELEDIIDYKKTLFIVISKSGETIETLSQYSHFRKNCENKKLDIKKHFVFVTDAKNGELRKIADKEKITSFRIPGNVSGRFSVLTAVGLLPARLIGIKIEKLLAGAKKMRKKFLSDSIKENQPFVLASIQFLLKKTMTVLMPYSQKLIKFTDWHRQLLAESIGKKFNNNGKIVNTGITPINALGVTDQHSQLQLYNEGPNDKLIIFIEIEKHEKNIFGKLLKIEKNATEQSLAKNNRPNITISINSLTEETLGELLMLFMCETAFLGEFFEINAFDQPGVELSKKLIDRNFAKQNTLSTKI
ncbi:MAG: glucose-6-phosphate isomerase [Patescibacteria group bacterium]